MKVSLYNILDDNYTEIFKKQTSVSRNLNSVIVFLIHTHSSSAYSLQSTT